MYMATIPRFYDDAESYPDLWWQSHIDGRNDVGFFSLRKEVLVIQRQTDDVGFCVLTHKRGGSAKVSPLMLSTSRHDMADAWGAIERYAREIGVRKMYFDIPTLRWQLFALLGPLGLRVEAHLARQYSGASDVLVAGKLLEDSGCRVTALRPPSRPAAPPDSGADPQHRWIPVTRNDQVALVEFTKSVLADDYDGLDESFVASLMGAIERKNNLFDEKGKFAFVQHDGAHISALAVLTPKRGGALKLGPLRFDTRRYSPGSVENAVRDLLEQIPLLPFHSRKLYSISAICDASLTAALRENGFRVEGVLQEPYRPGVDFVVCGRGE